MSTVIQSPLKPLHRWLAAIMGFVVLLSSLGFFSTRQWDFKVYFIAAHATAMGLNPYDAKNVLMDTSQRVQAVGYNGLPFLYPPYIARVLYPITKVSIFTAPFVWLCAKLIALECSIFLALRFLRFTPNLLNLCLLHVAAIYFRPIRLDLNAGNVAVFEMVFLYTAFWFWSRKQETYSAVALSFAGCMKWVPFIFLFYPLHLRRWNFLKSLMICLSVLGILLLIDYRLTSEYVQFYRSITWKSMWDEQVQSFFNCSATTVILRSFSDTYFATPIYNAPQIVPFLVPAFPVTIFILSGMIVRKYQKSRDFDPADPRIVSFILCTMLLLPPRLAGYTLSWTWLPMLVLFVHSIRCRSYVGIIIGCVSLYLYQADIPPEHVSSGITQLLIDKDFFALLLLYIGLAIQIFVTKKPE